MHDTASLELRGRVAHRRLLIFDDDPPVRVHWVATTTSIYFDERPRLKRAHRSSWRASSAVERLGDLTDLREFLRAVAGWLARS